MQKNQTLAILAAFLIPLGTTLMGAAQANTPSRATTIAEPAIPMMQPLTVPQTHLTANQLTSDIQDVNRLMQAHPGDGSIEGPDQLVYNIDCALSPSTHEVAGHIELHLHNNLGIPIHMLYFNVWPDSPHYRRAGGYTSVSDVTVNHQSVRYTLHGTLLSIPLLSPIAPAYSATVDLGFLSKLPVIDDRYGVETTTLNLGNWFPILAVHDSQGWNTPPYFTDGESFYSLTSAFHVHVTAPKNLVIAATGQTDGSPSAAGNGLVTTTYTALGVRDFAMVADPTYHTLSATVGNTAITTYFTPSQASTAPSMETTAKQALASYEHLYGPYPYSTLRVCAMNGLFGGMEYPQLVMVSLNPTVVSQADTRIDVAHEVAHQWFYSMIGDNQFLNPFVDESFATFAENRFDGTLPSLTDIPSSNATPGDPVFAFPSSDFPQYASDGIGFDDYSNQVYTRGAKTLADLMQLLGPVKFDKMMEAYFLTYQYRVATTADFMKYVSTFCGQDLTHFFSDHGIVANAIQMAPVQEWATLESSENQRAWH